MAKGGLPVAHKLPCFGLYSLRLNLFMKSLVLRLLIAFLFCMPPAFLVAQLQITPHPNAQALAQRLVGDGVSISNVSFTGNSLMAAFFNNLGNNNISIDSGIVLTSGRAKTSGSNRGLDGNGTTTASSALADNPWGLPGDAALAAAIGSPLSALEDACVLEFDFTPLGDSIKFSYIFSSEEYTPEYVCEYNDAFAFFISGPGITGLKNIALVPNTTIPVSIFNVNDVPGGTCPNNTAYYIDNAGNTRVTHDGHTTLLTAQERVQPCQTYHLKLVISDVGDDLYDSGVFLQAKSLSSNVIKMTNLTQTDPATGLSYLVEGCQVGGFNVRRQRKDPLPLNVTLSYGGTAQNIVDIQAMPTSVVIPANDSLVEVNVVPVIDGVTEGIELFKIYALAGCASGNPTDSTIIQIRDYDILSLSPDTTVICRSGSVQLNASTGYTTYQWNPDPTLSSTSIPNPVASPVNNTTTYICTANIGTCNAQDSVFVQLKTMEFVSKTEVNCLNGSTGVIKVAGGREWLPPVSFSLDGISWQSDSTFNNLRVGTYWVKMKDAFCTDSVQVIISQAYPDLVVDNSTDTPATCSGNPDGRITIFPAGGLAPYLYSTDGISFQASNIFNVNAGSFTVTVKDQNGCTTSRNFAIPLNDTIAVDAGADAIICEGTSYTMQATSNGALHNWSPAGSLSNAASLNPAASPADTTKYYLTATTGICVHTDSVTINVRKAPVPDAGVDIDVCFGKIIQLNGAGGVQFRWSPVTYMTSPANIQSPSIKATEDIIYSLHVTDMYGCHSLAADQVAVNVTPAVKIFAGKDTVAAINQPLQLKVVELGNSGVTNYSWSPGNFLSNAAVANPVATLPHDYRYVVTGTTPEGCQGQDDIFIKVYKGPEIYVPSGFTPDGNGLNDILLAIPVGIREFRYFRIYNRWGQLVFATQNPATGWNGQLGGANQPTGTYVWIAEAIDFRGNLMQRKGTVTIIR